MGAVGTAAVYWLGGRQAVTGHLAVGTVVALAAYVTRLYSPLTDLASTRVDVLGAIVSFDRVFEVLDTPPSVADKPDAVPLESVEGRIEARDVWFRYPAAADVSVASLEASAETVNEGLSTQPGDWVLRDVSFVAEPGTMTALVGPSGAGKTTLSSLVPRLYDAVEGSLSIDGHDVRDVTIASLSAAVGVVTQDAHLFHDTIAANLRYARPMPPTPRSWRPAGRRASTTSSPRCRRATRRSSASAATGCRAGKSNAWRSPGSCSRIRPS